MTHPANQNHFQMGKAFIILEYLDTLKHRPEPIIGSRLFTKIPVSTSTIVNIINKLEQKGLVERVLNPDNQRDKPIRITEKGSEVARASITLKRLLVEKT